MLDGKVVNGVDAPVSLRRAISAAHPVPNRKQEREDTEGTSAHDNHKLRSAVSAAILPSLRIESSGIEFWPSLILGDFWDERCGLGFEPGISVHFLIVAIPYLPVIFVRSHCVYGLTRSYDKWCTRIAMLVNSATATNKGGWLV